MKKKLLILFPLVVGFSVPVIFNANNGYQRVEAYSTNSLPTTIILNDTSVMILELIMQALILCQKEKERAQIF